MPQTMSNMSPCTLRQGQAVIGQAGSSFGSSLPPFRKASDVEAGLWTLEAPSRLAAPELKVCAYMFILFHSAFNILMMFRLIPSRISTQISGLLMFLST